MTSYEWTPEQIDALAMMLHPKNGPRILAQHLQVSPVSVFRWRRGRGKPGQIYRTMMDRMAARHKFDPGAKKEAVVDRPA